MDLIVFVYYKLTSFTNNYPSYFFVGLESNVWDLDRFNYNVDRYVMSFDFIVSSSSYFDNKFNRDGSFIVSFYLMIFFSYSDMRFSYSINPKTWKKFKYPHRLGECISSYFIIN